MDRRRGRLARWLGGPSIRRRRHRRVVLLGVGLLLVAGGLVLFGGDDDGTDHSDAAAVCADFSERVQSEFELSFPEGAPLNDDAAAEYLSHAFADTMDEFVVALGALELDGDLTDIVTALGDRIDAVRSGPDAFVHASPMAGIAEQFDEADLSACGSEFLAPSE